MNLLRSWKFKKKTEMMHFFEVYKSLEHKKTTVREIAHRDDAVEIIKKCIKAYNAKYAK